MPGISVLVQQLRALIGGRIAEGLPDQHLLEQFLSQRDEASFAAILERHGAMVLGVCRRVLHDEHLAEDAFQATFLILAQGRYDSQAAISEQLAAWCCSSFGTKGEDRSRPVQTPRSAKQIPGNRRPPCRSQLARSAGDSRRRTAAFAGEVPFAVDSLLPRRPDARRSGSTARVERGQTERSAGPRARAVAFSLSPAWCDDVGRRRGDIDG